LLNKVTKADCSEILPNIPNKSIDLVVTDPPYNMAYSGRGKTREQHFEGFDNDDMNPEEHSEWFFRILKELHRVLKDDTAIYIFIDFRNYARIYQLVNAFFDIKNCIVWNKKVFGMGQCYRFQHEFIIYAHKGKPTLRLPKKNVPDVWDIGKINTQEYCHPTMKPIAVMALPIKHSSDKGGIVLDPFIGSGTTAMACKELDRNYIGIEIDEEYANFSNKRTNQQTLF